MTSAPDVFAQTFAAWSIELPADAVAERRNGTVHQAGWQIRYRWHPDGSLEYRAGHRMTNERWAVIGPDGEVSNQPVPSEFTYTPPDATDAEKQAIKDAHHAEWTRHGETVRERGMAYDQE